MVHVDILRAGAEKNTGSTSESVDDLDLTNLVGAARLDVSCVLPGGAEVLPDRTFCEPGTLMPGQSANLVLDTNVAAGRGSYVSARVGVSNEQTGFPGPCVSRSVKSA